MRGIEPGAGGWEARTLPLCYAAPHRSEDLCDSRMKVLSLNNSLVGPSGTKLLVQLLDGYSAVCARSENHLWSFWPLVTQPEVSDYHSREDIGKTQKRASGSKIDQVGRRRIETRFSHFLRPNSQNDFSSSASWQKWSTVFVDKMAGFPYKIIFWPTYYMIR